MIDFTVPTAIKNYFEALAASHVDIDEFVYGDNDVIQGIVKSRELGTFLWLTYKSEIQLLDSISDNILGKIPNTLMVLAKAPSELHADQETTTGNSEIIVRDIISKLYLDYQSGEITTELGGYKFGEAEPVFGANKFIGTWLDFNIIRPEKLIYNPAKWL